MFSPFTSDNFYDYEIKNTGRFVGILLIVMLVIFAVSYFEFNLPFFFYRARIVPFAFGFVIAYIIELGISAKESISYDKGDEFNAEYKKLPSNALKYLTNPHCKVLYSKGEQKIICKEIPKVENGRYRQSEITYSKMYGMYSLYKIIEKKFNDQMNYDELIDVAQSATAEIDEKLV